MPEVVKAYLVHNYLASKIRYTLKDDATPLEKSYQQSAYGALILKKCVCQGYAEAFKRFMDEAGIGCDVVCGQTKGSDTYHAWNILRLHGGRECYHVDVTWDCVGDGTVKHTYFGVTDSFFKGKRTWNTDFHVPCNGTEDLKRVAQEYVARHMYTFLRREIDEKILGN